MSQPTGPKTKTGHVLSEADLAKQQARKAQKAAKKAAGKNANEEPILAQGTPRILKRDWIDLKRGEGEGNEGEKRLRVVTWNMLAQTLVRRDLFPGSDCLKFKDRGDMLAEELRSYPSDIICLQEEDRLDEIPLDLPNHTPISARGPGKKHGLSILFDHSQFKLASKRVIQYDLEHISPPPEGQGDGQEEESEGTDEARRRRGGTRQTKNIGLMVGLEYLDQPGKGIIIATTHLFWHPQYAYERTRQALILFRSVKQFQKDLDVSWPAVVAGDFNTQPKEAVYHLLTRPSAPLPSTEIDGLDFSRAVHDSLSKVEESIKLRERADKGQTEGQEQEGEEDDKEDEGPKTSEPIPTDRPKGTRHRVDSDGLVDPAVLQDIAKKVLGEGVRSAYASSGWVGEGNKGLSYAGRGGEGEEGADEPAWTSFTPLWRLTLDYLFDFPQTETTLPYLEPRRVLAPHKTQDLEPGLPRKGLCASDHVLLGVEYAVLD